jgi:NAD(P)-dependent dehydrogenase (short-subunit alcohol dehydrogenase family)
MSVPNFSLDGKIALITGGSSGIGKAIALTFAGAGAHIAVCARHLPALEKVAEEIRALGRSALAIQANIRLKEDVDNMVQMTAKEFGGIDTLVNNACETKNPHKTLVDLPEEEWDIVMDTDLKGYYLCSQAVGRIMIEKKEGNIINMSSISAVIPETPLGAYSIAKAGVAMMTKMLAVELAPYNIRVNAVGPGFVRTGMTDHYWAEPGGLEKLKPWIDRTPLKRFAESSDVAAAALFLASDASRSITGHTIFVDGGWLIA